MRKKDQGATSSTRADLPQKLIDDIWAFCDPFLQVCDDLEVLLTENRIFKQRNVGIAEVKLAAPRRTCGCDRSTATRSMICTPISRQTCR